MVEEDNEKPQENTFQARAKLGVKDLALTARFTFDTPKSSMTLREFLLILR